jgi:Flp pilus assembly protein TadD
MAAPSWHGSSADTLWRDGLEALESGRVEDAAHLLREAVRLDPQHGAAWNDLGVLMESLGNPTEAARCYQGALRSDPTHAEAARNLLALALQLQTRQMLKRTAAQAVRSRMAW